MMLEPEKLQNRGKQGWPDAWKGTGHKGDKKVNTLVRHKWMSIEQPNALGDSRSKARTSAAALLSLSQTYIRTSSCMHSGGAHGPSHVVLQETVYKRLLQLAQACSTMPAFTSRSFVKVNEYYVCQI